MKISNDGVLPLLVVLCDALYLDTFLWNDEFGLLDEDDSMDADDEIHGTGILDVFRF